MVETLASIVMPCYNAQNTIYESIESIRQQTYTNWELLVVDDGSNDDSVAIVSELMSIDHRIKLFSQINAGVGAARNLAILKSSGRYLAFCDADDLWHPSKLQLQLDFIKKNNLAFSYSGYAKIDIYGEVLLEISVPRRITYNNLLSVNHIGCLTAIYDVSKLGKFYFENLKMGEDYEKWLRIFSKIKETEGIDSILAYYRVSSSSLSANKLMALQYRWKVLGLRTDISTLRRILVFFNYMLNGVKKSTKIRGIRKRKLQK